MDTEITGRTASEIAADVRRLVDSGELTAGDSLPPVRHLAERLEVNRNTVMAAYRLLVRAGVAVTRGRAGTSIVDPEPIPEEGFSRDTTLHDLGSGNPDPARLPDPAPVLATLADEPVLYGEPVIDPALAEWAARWISEDRPGPFHLSVTGGAVDAVERLLAQALTQGDAVALEDPCFLTSIHTVRTAGYRTVPVPVDGEGMTVDGLRAALDAGVRAVVCTPRAHNPTGVGLGAARAEELRVVLADHPYVLVIEDDHFSLLSRAPYRSLIGPGHARWALVRSVSKFLGPDLRLALVASDPEVATRLGSRLSPGTMWVSHLLQRLAGGLLTDPEARRVITEARDHYARRNDAFVALSAEHGVTAHAADGLNVWVDVRGDARRAARRLMRRGWLARPGDDFSLSGEGAAVRHLRMTVHDLTDERALALVRDLAETITDPDARTSP